MSKALLTLIQFTIYYLFSKSTSEDAQNTYTFRIMSSFENQIKAMSLLELILSQPQTDFETSDLSGISGT